MVFKVGYISHPAIRGLVTNRWIFHQELCCLNIFIRIRCKQFLWKSMKSNTIRIPKKAIPSWSGMTFGQHLVKAANPVFARENLCGVRANLCRGDETQENRRASPRVFSALRGSSERLAYLNPDGTTLLLSSALRLRRLSNTYLAI